MKVRIRWLPLFFLLLVLAAPAVAQVKLTVEATLQPASARPGDEVLLVLTAAAPFGHHAYGAKEETNIPVALDPKALILDGFERIGAAVVPDGSLKTKFGVDAYPLPDVFSVTQKLKVAAGFDGAQATLRGSLDYQLCDANMCLAPAQAPFEAKLVILAANPSQAPGEAVDARAPVGEIAVGEITADEAANNDDPLRGSLWALILACIGGGLFALVMPCTYPMIPITFSFFTKQADARGGKVLPLALAYGIGIVAMFTLIGALAGLVGEQINRFAAHWVTNVVIGSAFLVFAFSLLGVFTLQPPQFLVNAVGKSRGVGGIFGVLLMGATLVVTSFTCTAPVVGLLLLPAVQSGDSLRPALGMAAFGLTMALPFVALALLPGRVRALPKSGEWMNTLKVTLGFIELAAALKFFSNAEYVAQLYVLPRELFFGIWIAIFTALAVYLLGIWPKSAVGNGRRFGAMLSLAVTGYCIYGALGYRLDFVMNALSPAYGLKEIVRHTVVVDDYEAAVARAKDEGKLVLVNFSGFTCGNCRMVERGILPDEQIAPLLEAQFVEARLHMDNPDVIAKEKWERHVQLRQDLIAGRISTPTYVSVDPNAGEAIVEHVLSGDWLSGYRKFLEDTLQKTGRPMPPMRQ